MFEMRTESQGERAFPEEATAPPEATGLGSSVKTRNIPVWLANSPQISSWAETAHSVLSAKSDSEHFRERISKVNLPIQGEV